MCFRQADSANLYELDEVAAYFSKILVAQEFKNPDIKPRLTLVMSVREGLGFTKKLQQMLLQNYGIYVDVIANENVIHEQFEYNSISN